MSSRRRESFRRRAPHARPQEPDSHLSAGPGWSNRRPPRRPRSALRLERCASPALPSAAAVIQGLDAETANSFTPENTCFRMGPINEPAEHSTNARASLLEKRAVVMLYTLTPLRREMSERLQESLMTTSFRSLATALLCASLTAVLLAQAPALNVKMGLWEITTTAKVGGQPPAIDTGKMTPE